MQQDLVARAQQGDLEAFSDPTVGRATRLYAAARLILRDDAASGPDTAYGPLRAAHGRSPGCWASLWPLTAVMPPWTRCGQQSLRRWTWARIPSSQGVLTPFTLLRVHGCRGSTLSVAHCFPRILACETGPLSWIAGTGSARRLARPSHGRWKRHASRDASRVGRSEVAVSWALSAEREGKGFSRCRGRTGADL